MVCPYNNFISCTDVDISGMDKHSCEKCEACLNYKNRIRDSRSDYYNQHNLYLCSGKSLLPARRIIKSSS
jgi:hypothetical protein